MRRSITFTIICIAWFFSCTRHNRPKILTEDLSGILTSRLIELATARFAWKGGNGSEVITKMKSKFTSNLLRINGDEMMKTGNFPSFVKVPLNGRSYSKYKLSCTSPENTGMFIDEFNIFNNALLTFDSISLRHVEVPLLKRNENTPVFQVQVHTSGVAGSLKLNELNIDFSGTTDLKDLDNVSLFYTGSNSGFNNEVLVSETGNIANTMKLEGGQSLKHGTNYFWICVKLNGNADLGNIVDISCDWIKVGGKKIKPKRSNPEGVSRMGVALRKHNDDNVDTYRIPGLATTNEGTLIAVYDIRRNNGTDLQEDIDIGMNRSTDGGKTWEPMKVIMDMEEWGGLPDDQNGIGDPAVLVDRQTNTIWVAAIWAHGHPGKRNWRASGQGMVPAETSQLMLVKSEDDGLTWSEEINVTKQVKNPDWHLLLQGPGKGITLQDGTLVFPAQFKDATELPHSTIIWSKDHGKSWHIGVGAKENTTEAQVIERNDGTLMLNMRDNRNRTDPSETNGRSVYITTDLGKSWKKHITSRTNVLQEPTCQASLVKEDFMVNGKMRSLVLFSNPNTKKGRHHMSVKVSFDDGETWDLSKTLLLDESPGRGYSCMTKIDDNTVGILYEGSQADMTFQTISISDILSDRSMNH